ncbi:hypothetical protein B6V73_19080 [Thioclava sp. JM3]|uniref:DUF302 domain-containing protein n=1 Tax=Thioclava sp. JM3 TaxID=1973004 RepID=UPI000B53EFD8|nr:DUF302 domain-containing protein [Thioclava sp. JM3]OWY11610.1 hypothetical protein B6V73_19080 [Thioclava sp. JM3]
MSYTIDKRLTNTTMEEADTRTREALKEQGFGVLTEIDVQGTMKKKLDEDMPGYMILGACNPKMAHQAIQLEPNVGAMLPCNVILRQDGSDILVCAIDPEASMTAIDNPQLKSVAGEVRDMLAKAIEAI